MDLRAAEGDDRLAIIPTHSFELKQVRKLLRDRHLAVDPERPAAAFARRRSPDSKTESPLARPVR
jgi:hypothetical protein